jgi:hypothetical protein
VADYTSSYTGQEIEAALERGSKAALPAKPLTVTLSASGWSGGKQAVTNDLFLAAGYTYFVSPAASKANAAAYAKAGIMPLDVTVDGAMTFVCDKTPTVDVTVSILIQEVATSG